MYTTCCFCHAALGRNETLEAFPVGRRLAYDAAKGRLWVVCRGCERWNLTPLEERWEAIEGAERLYRETRLRAATDNVGLARIDPPKGDGLELVRIGAPLRPEFAAWRYGDQFGRRRKRHLMMSGAGVVALTAVYAGGMAAGMSIGAFGWIFGRGVSLLTSGSPATEIVRIPPPGGGEPLRVLRGHLTESSLGPGVDGGLALSLRHAAGTTVFTGDAAERATALLVPHVNRSGGGRKTVQQAVRELEEHGGPARYLGAVARAAGSVTTPHAKAPKKWGAMHDLPKKGLYGLPEVERLALEMALHEERERRALEGELQELERAWREADEIAGIADNLFLPAGIDDQLARLRADAARGEGAPASGEEGAPRRLLDR